MTPMEIEFYRNLGLAFAGAVVIWIFMERAQRRKQAKADAQYELTMKMIEMRNKKYEAKNEPEKKT